MSQNRNEDRMILRVYIIINNMHVVCSIRYRLYKPRVFYIYILNKCIKRTMIRDFLSVYYIVSRAHDNNI